MTPREQMNIVVVGHVDHGKSTVIGRLLADTGSLPQGKLEEVRARCARTARPFEYAFLLDALKDEQAQGITIDTARCFFKSARRDYIIIDAPGHVEFLKNMVTGAARAEAALLVIDAHEGIQENSRRHGYLLSMLGIRQVAVVVNKMDLTDYSQERYRAVVEEYRTFLDRIGITAAGFIPVSAMRGHNLCAPAAPMAWYAGPTVLEQVDAFVKQSDAGDKPLRLPVQDVYKFTESGDDRRIFAGTVESGSARVGDEVVFLPGGTRSVIATVEGFNTPPATEIRAGQATGVTLVKELYVPRGEIMCRVEQPQPDVGVRFRANIFWMGRAPMVCGRKYKLKIATARTFVRLVSITTSIEASELSSVQGKTQIDRHDVADCILETTRPIAFDTIHEEPATARFVIVDNYEIAGGGIILEPLDTRADLVAEHIRAREINWDTGLVTPAMRERRFGHQAKFVAVCGHPRSAAIARELEKVLFDQGFRAYYLGLASMSGAFAQTGCDDLQDYEEQVWRLGELARVMTGSGMIFISALPDAQAWDLQVLTRLNSPFEVLFAVSEELGGAADPHRVIVAADCPDAGAVDAIVAALQAAQVFTDYVI